MQLSNTEPVQLWRCYGCSSSVFDADMEQGQGCMKCGSRKVCKAPPTLRYIAAYFWRHPRELVRYVRELA